MLILERKPKSYGVVVSGPCHIKVICTSPKSVRLGFTADKSVTILREELIDAERENRGIKPARRNRG